MLSEYSTFCVIAIMEWDPAHEGDDDLVLPPKQQESSFDDLPPTTDSCWPQWGINNINTTPDASLFHNKPSVYDRPDFQFNQMAGGDDRTDDIFVYTNSLFKEDQQQPPPPPGSAPESQRIFMPGDGNANNMSTWGFLCGSSDAYGPESSGHYETGRLTYTPPAVWVNNERPTDACLDGFLLCAVTCSDAEISMEESVLNQLETVMTLLNDNTRLCFRDSLYRLARSMKGLRPTCGHNAGFSLNDHPPLASDNQMARSGTAAGVAESETNAFDRTVANLMFNKADGFFPASSSKSKDVPAGFPASYNYSMIRDLHHHSQPQIVKTESQDPFLSMVNQQHISQKDAGLPDPSGSDIRWTAHGDSK